MSECDLNISFFTMNKIAINLTYGFCFFIFILNTSVISLAQGVSIRPSGDVYDESGNHLGIVRSSGDVYKDDGTRLGKIGDDGEVYDNDANRLGQVQADGDVYDNDGNLIDEVDSQEEAVILFFF